MSSRFGGEDPVILVHDLEGGMDMEIVGTLEYDTTTGCLLLMTQEPTGGEFLTLPAWPDGTRPVMEDGRAGVDVPGVGVILDGDEVDGGAGGVDPGTLGEVDLPAGCGPPAHGVEAITSLR